MCSIFGSFGGDDEIKQLQSINMDRGVLSSSSTVYFNTGEITTVKTGGPITNFRTEFRGQYRLFHQQAPTTQESNTIHPSQYHDSYLWHNGIVKTACIESLRKELGERDSWDTHLINVLLNTHGLQSLSKVDGSFSCVWWLDRELMMFRNQISPMFYKGATISSVEFDGSKPTAPNTLYRLDVVLKQWDVINTFTNNELPFFFFE